MLLKNWASFWVIGLGTLLGPLDTAVNIAFPDITRAFGIPLASIQWVIISYVLTYASLMLVFGRLGDQFGHLRIFRLGLVISAISFIACGLARQFEILLAFRILQGVGTAMIISCGPALTTGIFDEAQRPRVLAAYTLVIGLGSAIGPSLGGLMLEFWSWPAVFWFRLPIAITALILSLRLRLPTQSQTAGKFDFFGAGLLAGFLALLLLTFNQLRNPEIDPLILVLLGLISVAAMAGFVLRELKFTAPILDIRLFRNIDFSLINLSNIAINLFGFSVLLLVPYYLTKTTDLTIFHAGLVLASSPVGMILAARFGGRWLPRFGANRLAFSGILLVALAVTSIGYWPASAATPRLLVSLFLHGFGLGLFQVACLEFVVAVVPRVNRGVAGSLVMVTRTMGVVFSASLVMLYFVGQVAAANDDGVADSFLTGFQSTFVSAGVCLLVFLGLTCLRPGLWFARRKH